MSTRSRTFLAILLVLCFAVAGEAEILVRWDQNDVPSPQSLGVTTLVVPAKNMAAIQSALGQGYRLYLELDASAVATFSPPARGLSGVVVKGRPTPIQLRQLRQQLKPFGARVISLDERGKWPHIRSNWVTRNNDVLQVTGRSAQPWIENNAALVRIAHAVEKPSPGMLTYAWQPITLSDVDEGPALENYLVAIAEAGSFGADLLLPLHERFQSRLLLAQPRARAEWAEIRRYLEFYSWTVQGRYEPIANIGVVTAEPMLAFEVMNLLLRHNLPFELVSPTELRTRASGGFKLFIVLDPPAGPQLEALAEFERTGGKVHRVTNGIADPNAFAFEVRKILGPEHRVIDIWNGITVMTAPFKEPNGSALLVTAVNYAHQPLPVQLRVPGTFSVVHFESPEEPMALLPLQHRDGYTEFVLPALRVGGRVFLSR